ncbi:MAG: hypothetical protein IPK16_13820 [Anaerolineales bacterium]|nr:hypothetical protein [Anaerolineales bacterium]
MIIEHRMQFGACYGKRVETRWTRSLCGTGLGQNANGAFVDAGGDGV